MNDSNAIRSDSVRGTADVPAGRDKAHVPVNGDTFADHNPGHGRSPRDADERHRREFARYASAEGHEPYRDPMGLLYAAFDGWNRDYFDGGLLPPHFLLAEPKSPRALGDHSLLSAWGSTNQTRIRPSILNGTHPMVRPGGEFAEGRLRLVLDIAMHETVHQYATEILKKPEDAYRGHGPVFRDLCNSIGTRLGLRPVRTAKARGKERHLPSCTEWPICVRPKGYYLGAYLPHEVSEDFRRAEKNAPPEQPKLLAEWMATHPEWAACYCRFGEVFFSALDRFFDACPAPDPVQEQAVMFLAKSYRHHLRTRSVRRPALPAPVE